MRAELVETVRRAAEAAGPIDQAATDLAELIRGRSGRRWVGIYRVTRSEVVNLAWSGPAPPAHPRFPVGQGLTGAAVAGRATVCSNDVAADPRYLTNQETTGSELIVPIMLHGRVVGTLDVEEAHTDAFAPDDERRFEAVARLLSPSTAPPGRRPRIRRSRSATWPPAAWRPTRRRSTHHARRWVDGACPP